MKILYIIPTIEGAGGLARVVSIKANYLVEKLDYKIDILTQNSENVELFHRFNSKIGLHDIKLSGNVFNYFLQYRKQLINKVNKIQPDIVVVTDLGLKAFMIPFLLNKGIPILFEVHGTKHIEFQEVKKTLFYNFSLKILDKYKTFCASKFDRFIVETNAGIDEWRIKNSIVIPNPIWFSTNEKATLKSQKVIAAARHSYEKGLDRLLKIWKKVIEKYPNWSLDIYGDADVELKLIQLAKELNIANNVTFYDPVTNINEKYNDYSMYLMTSRYEGFGMVLIEAMTCGVPCIAYDCPCGPKAIISNKEDGFLIENGNEENFINAIFELIENENLRKELGEKAIENTRKYNIEPIMNEWNKLFIEIIGK